MSKGYSSEDAQERLQRARQPRPADEEAEAERVLAAAPPRAGADRRVACLDTSDVLPGRLAEVRAATAELAAFVEAREPRTLAYEVFLSPDGARMTVLQVHPDPASMEHHMRVAGPAFARFAPLLRLREMHLYGEPSQELLALLRRKLELLGGTLEVHARHAGFARFPAR